MNYIPEYTGAFKKDYKRIVKRGYNIVLLKKIVDILLSEGSIPSGYKPHILVGNYKGYMECHILPGWLLIWKINHNDKVVTFVRTGTHSDLF